MNVANVKELSLLAILIMVVAASATDLFSDLSHGASGQHIAKEGVIMLVAVIGATWLLYGFHQQNMKIALLRKELADIRKPLNLPSEYVVTARRKLSEVMAQQFEEWGLSAGEKEVGLLLLKGLSLKEIAALRNTLEKTVRQQASSIYKKAGVPGRHAFAAWFIEDFL